MSATTTAGLRPRSLPVLRELADSDVDEDTFRRLGVAYGLSFDGLDTGRIVPPSEIEDIEPARLEDWCADFIDKDMV